MTECLSESSHAFVLGWIQQGRAPELEKWEREASPLLLGGRSPPLLGLNHALALS